MHSFVERGPRILIHNTHHTALLADSHPPPPPVYQMRCRQRKHFQLVVSAFDRGQSGANNEGETNEELQPAPDDSSRS